MREIYTKDTLQKDFNIKMNNSRIVKWDYVKLKGSV